MSSVETCGFSLCNKFYTYLYRHIVVLDKYIHPSLVDDNHFNNNNNNNIYLLQLGCYPMAVVILHVNKT